MLQECHSVTFANASILCTKSLDETFNIPNYFRSNQIYLISKNSHEFCLAFLINWNINKVVFLSDFESEIPSMYHLLNENNPFNDKTKNIIQ